VFKSGVTKVFGEDEMKTRTVRTGPNSVVKYVYDDNGVFLYAEAVHTVVRK
jgi:hypothetical protein